MRIEGIKFHDDKNQPGVLPSDHANRSGDTSFIWIGVKFQSGMLKAYSDCSFAVAKFPSYLYAPPCL